MTANFHRRWTAEEKLQITFCHQIDYRRIVLENKHPTIRETMFAQIENKTLFEQAQSYAYSYLDTMYSRPVFPDSESIEKLAVFDEALPLFGIKIQHYA